MKRRIKLQLNGIQSSVGQRNEFRHKIEKNLSRKDFTSPNFTSTEKKTVFGSE